MSGLLKAGNLVNARLLLLFDEPDEQLEEIAKYHIDKAMCKELSMNKLIYLSNLKDDYETISYSNDLQPLLSGLPQLRTILLGGTECLAEVTGIVPSSFHHKKSGSLSRLVGSVWSLEEVISIRAACQPQREALVFPPKLHSIVAALHPSIALRGSMHLMPTVYQMIKRARDLSLEETF